MRWLPNKHALLVTVTLSVLALDQATKFAIQRFLEPGERVALIKGFLYLAHERNPGAAFGLLSTVPGNLRLPVFAAIFAVAALVVWSIHRSLAPGERAAVVALACVLGGASGNLIDRVIRDGEVIDLLYLRLWSGYTWPDFNLADTAIVLGVLGLMLQLLANEGESRARVDGARKPPDDPIKPEDSAA